MMDLSPPTWRAAPSSAKSTLSKLSTRYPLPQKTAVTTLFGLFEYNYMPFVLCNAGQTLQKMQDSIFIYLPCTFVDLDDQRMASRGMDNHVEDLRAVLRRLSDNGLAINLEKCEFTVEELDFLGHRLRENFSTINNRE
jgi:hypothetical protein